MVNKLADRVILKCYVFWPLTIDGRYTFKYKKERWISDEPNVIALQYIL